MPRARADAPSCATALTAPRSTFAASSARFFAGLAFPARVFSGLFFSVLVFWGLVLSVSAAFATPVITVWPEGELVRLGESLEIDVQLREPIHVQLGVPRRDAPWVRLIVEQIGSDVTLELKRSSGTPWLADQPLGHHQPELLVVPSADSHLILNVRVPGRVRVRWEEVDDDDPRLAGDLAWTRATHLFAQDTKDSLISARAGFLDAASIYGDAGLLAEEGRALLAAGHLAADIGETEQGLEWHRRSLRLRRQAGDRHGEADALQQIGHVLRLRGEQDGAREALTEALEVATALGEVRSEARALLNLGFIAHRSGQPDLARSRYGRALKRLESARDPGLEEKLLNNLAGVDFESGQLRSAVLSFERLLDFELGVADPRAQARTLINLAAARRWLGRYQETLEAYDEALDVLEQIGEPRLEASVLNNLGFTYLRLGDLERAEERFEAALEKRRAAGDQRGTATTLNNLGRTAMAAGDWTRAASRFEEALKIRRELGEARGQARSLHDLGRLELERGRTAAAREALEWAMLARRELGNSIGEASSAAELAKVHLATGELTQALELATRAVDTFERLGSRGDEASARLTRLRVYRGMGHVEAAAEEALRALEVVEALRLEVESPELRATQLTVARELYEETVDLRVASGDWSGAFAVAERARARAFLEVLHGLGSARMAPENQEQHRRLVEDLAGLRYAMQRSRRRGEPPSEELQAAWRETRLQIDRLEHVRVGDAEPSANVDSLNTDRPPVLDLQQFQQLLDSGTRALVFFLAEKRSYLWLIERDWAELLLLPPRAELASLSERALDHLRIFDPRGGPAVRAATTQMAAALRLDAAVSSSVGRSTPTPTSPGRLILVAEGPLLRLPFAALPQAGEPLIESFEISYLPSASALPTLRAAAAANRAGREPQLAVIADPVYEVDHQAKPDPGTVSSLRTPGAGLTRLDGSHREAESLSKIEGLGSHRLLGHEARRTAVLGDALEPFTYVHFATHATVDAERPELSALVLSLADSQGRPIDGYVRLADVYAMSLSADLVVLSGCDTGLGRDVPGEGLLGLARGFFFAGAARVASSLWRVEDDATAELMSRFYRFLAVDRETPAAALRRAQLSMRSERRFRHPFFWSAFTIQGDWRPAEPER